MKRCLSVASLLTMIILMASTASAEDAIVGAWKVDGHPTVWRFFKDKTYMTEEQKGNTGGRFELYEKNQLKIIPEGLASSAGPQLVYVKISSRTMVFCKSEKSDKDCITFHKVE